MRIKSLLSFFIEFFSQKLGSKINFRLAKQKDTPWEEKTTSIEVEMLEFISAENFSVSQLFFLLIFPNISESLTNYGSKKKSFKLKIFTQKQVSTSLRSLALNSF